ncbi:hypothetical protein SAMN05192553_11527 [Cyclobacterium xiamenense]|uniref:Uncharacterized protein n=1 Tax=Cyclobacterium xiamenense TaxID=1297121 RepID=A0A1H7BW67_9BACT|nr:hypothetical protein SAMN05192553_11527 [Cyclobacterium xiamenense]
MIMKLEIASFILIWRKMDQMALVMFLGCSFTLLILSLYIPTIKVYYI